MSDITDDDTVEFVPEWARGLTDEQLAAMPDLPGAMRPVQPILECDTTPHMFQDEILTEPLDIHGQVAERGVARIPEKPGIGVEIDLDAIKRFEIA